MRKTTVGTIAAACLIALLPGTGQGQADSAALR